MRYRKPRIFRTNNNYEYILPCQSGMDPKLTPTCVVGPEAAAGGCYAGAAALCKCSNGSAVVGDT